MNITPQETTTAIGAVTAVSAGAADRLQLISDVLSIAGVSVGIVVAVIGLYFQLKRDRRDREFHAARMKSVNDE